MGVPGDLLLAAIGFGVVLFAPLEIAFGALVAFWLLVPGTLVVPFAPHLMHVDRVILYGFALRLLLRAGLPDEPKGSAYALGPLHAAVGVLLIVGFLDGVILAPRSSSLALDNEGWLYLLDLAVFFVVVHAVIRTIGPWRAARVVAGTLLVTIVVAGGEFLTHRGWSAFFFKHLPASYLTSGADGLQSRGGHVRPQVAAQFSLEYSWVLAMFLPFAIYASLRARRNGGRFSRWAPLLPLGVILGVVLTASRSAELAIPVEIVLFAVVSGADRHLLKWVAAVGGAGALFVVFDPSLVSKPFSRGAVSDPLSVRLERLPVLFAMVVHHPFFGIGFNGYARMFGGIDDAYASIYATLGVVGLVAWIGVFVTGAATAAATLRSPAGSDARRFGAACLIGIGSAMAAAATYDFQNTVQSPWGLIVLAAFGAVVAERMPHRSRSRRRWAVRMVVPATGVALGFALLASVPASASQSLSIQTVAPWVSDFATAPNSPYQGTALVNTLCPVVTSTDTISPGTGVVCVRAALFNALVDPGIALVTVRGPTPAAVNSEIRRSFAPIARLMPLSGGISGTMQVGKPAWATTAPVWGGLFGLLGALLVPPIRLRRANRRRAADARR
ncbi:MAG: O-antigen ligase family protein [Acidimicrobiales bacterium]